MDKCENCVHYDFDDLTQCYYCTVNMDEDECARYTQTSYKECPYFRYYDEYQFVRKQN